MIIESGKKYRDRRGRQVLILRDMKTDEPHRFLGVTIEPSGVETHETWTIEGRADARLEHSSWDIVGLWQEAKE